MSELKSEKFTFFSEILTCGQNLYLWEYDPAMNLIATSCENYELLSTLLNLDFSADCLTKAIADGNRKPMVLSNNFGITWIAAFEAPAGQVSRVYLLGPVFNADLSKDTLMREIGSGRFSKTLVADIYSQISLLPIIPLNTWLHYGLMLHYFAVGEKLEISDFFYPISTEVQNNNSVNESKKAAKEGTYLAEQTALQMIEQGRTDYQKAFSQLSMSAPFAVPESSSAPTRDFKNSVISFITLATRAAIRGGLSSEIAYYLGNQYIENVERCTNLSELMRINSTMFDDFVGRVHKVQSTANVSESIQLCCHYIELHLSEKITLKDLAKTAGYSEYYIAEKFKKELHVSVTDYINKKRTEQAMLLLRTTRDPIGKIADELGFCNSSYFADVFRKFVGVSPVKYRENHNPDSK